MAPAREEKRLRLLRRLRRRRFQRIRFRGLDAAVTEMSGTAPLPPAVQARLDQGLPLRIYPLGGDRYQVRWPHASGDLASEGVSLLAGGWDHEHCDGCNRNIEVGETFWQTARGSCYWLCPYCYRRLQQLARSGSSPAWRPRRP